MTIENLGPIESTVAKAETFPGVVMELSTAGSVFEFYNIIIEGNIIRIDLSNTAGVTETIRRRLYEGTNKYDIDNIFARVEDGNLIIDIPMTITEICRGDL